MLQLRFVLLSLLFSRSVFSAPAGNSTYATLASETIASSASDASWVSSAAEPTATVPFASTEPNDELWFPDSPDSVPKPERNQLGAPIMGPDNIPIDLENADTFAPPTTDNGDGVGNAKWPFSLSHMRLQTGGWSRQQNTQVFPIATSMAGVNMRLEAGAIRELHWHTAAEWAYVLKGTTQVTAVDQLGRNYIASVEAGDLWYFPPGIPHSLQATNDSAEGSEFLLVFPDGGFSDDGTFLLTDWLAHVPAEVIRKNFGVTNPQDFARIPAQQLYIFPGTPPPDDQPAPSDPQGTVPQPFFFPFSKMTPTQLEGGSYKVADSTVFNVSTQIAVAQVNVEPGGMRELHWHPTQDEWTYIISGTARVTVFAAQSQATTFDFQAGDIGFVPAAFGHYVENTGNSTLTYLEVFNTDIFQDVSLNQWLALTPPELVQAHLGLDNETISLLKKVKPVVVGPPTGNQ